MFFVGKQLTHSIHRWLFVCWQDFEIFVMPGLYAHRLCVLLRTVKPFFLQTTLPWHLSVKCGFNILLFKLWSKTVCKGDEVAGKEYEQLACATVPCQIHSREHLFLAGHWQTPVLESTEVWSLLLEVQALPAALFYCRFALGVPSYSHCTQANIKYLHMLLLLNEGNFLSKDKIKQMFPGTVPKNS